MDKGDADVRGLVMARAKVNVISDLHEGDGIWREGMVMWNGISTG